jgi:hypothetical protein
LCRHPIISQHFMEQKLHYLVHKSSSPVPILRYTNPVHTTQSYLCRIHLQLPTQLRLVLPSGLFPSGFLTNNLYTLKELESSNFKIRSQKRGKKEISNAVQPIRLSELTTIYCITLFRSLSSDVFCSRHFLQLGVASRAELSVRL